MLVSPLKESMFQSDKWKTHNNLQPDIHPMTTPLAALATLSADQLLSPNYDHCRFLVVDDNKINLRIMYHMLKKLFPLSHVDTLQDSRLVDYSQIHQYHVVFLDIEMPAVSGLDIASVIRNDAALEGVGLIAVTTKSSLNDVIVYKQCGFDYTFPKPFNLRDREILKRIEWVLEDRCGITRV